MKNKMCIVTGANSGIGYAVAKGLLATGASVIMACRSQKRADEARERLVRETGNAKVEVLLCDLSEKKSIQAFVENFGKRYSSLDVLCQCAGHTSFERTLTSDGIETNFATNVLGPYTLSKQLVPYLTQARGARIVNIVGEFHRMFSINFDDLFYERSFNPLRIGSISMLERIMLTYQLAEDVKDQNISVNCFHPGFVKTEMMDKLPPVARLLTTLLQPFQATPDEGADSCLWLATSSEEAVKVTGKYFIKRKMVKSSDSSYDKEAQKRLRSVCEKLV